MPDLVDNIVTSLQSFQIRITITYLLLAFVGRGQSADSLKNVRRVYVGSFGSYAGAEDLKRELVRYLRRSGSLEVVQTASQADGVLDGKGELWIRGYHSLSPRARINSSSAEPIYDGYLSAKIHGKDDEILWSYFADPRRVSFHDVKRDLANEVGGRLLQDHDLEAASGAPVQTQNDAPAELRGGGATFPFPLYQEWFKSFQSRHPAWRFTYVQAGSEAGIAQLAARTMDFAGTDIPPAALEGLIPSGSNSFPTVGGAVVLVYNLPKFTGELHLTADLIASIFSGAVRSWDDPALRASNAQTSLPSAPIITFHRSDGSGTTYALTDFLSKASADWKRSPGTGARLQWPSGTGVNGNQALAQSVASTPYSLGYVEFIYAFEHHLSIAAIRNAAGRFVYPDLLSIMAAGNGAGDREEYMRLSITNAPEKTAYPISTLVGLSYRQVWSHHKRSPQRPSSNGCLLRASGNARLSVTRRYQEISSIRNSARFES